MVCANGVFSQMMGQESGKIISISSSTAYWDTPEFLHYIASKAAGCGTSGM
jgi:short-subunit dehydrogenase